MRRRDSTTTAWAAVVAALVLGTTTGAGLSVAPTLPPSTATTVVQVIDSPIQPLSAYEWRRLDLTPISTLTRGFDSFRAIGGTTVSLDISYVVDITEIADPSARAAAQANWDTKLHAYSARAASAGLRVEALAGSPHWIHPDVRYVNTIVAQYAASFNATAPISQRLAGIHFDLEPWGTPEWISRSPELTKQLLDSVAAIVANQSATAPSRRLPVVFDLPFWLDGTAAPKTVGYRGASMSPTQHVLRMLDNNAGVTNAVSIMAYRNTTSGVDGSIAVLANEFGFGAAYSGRVKVIIAQEIGNVQPARTTFHRDGIPALMSAINTLRATYGANPAFGGFAIDNLEALG